MNQPSIERIAELQQLIANFASIERMPHLADKKRRENDVEHSYGLALTAWFLAGKIAPELSPEKILKYALAHDIVELHAGDTFVFASSEELNTKSDREDAAIARIRHDWPDFTELADYAYKYKNEKDEEAKFVYALDKLLPVLMVNLGEKSDFWNHHKVTLQMQMAEKEPKMKTSPFIAPYYDRLVEWMSDPDYFYHDDNPSPVQ